MEPFLVFHVLVMVSVSAWHMVIVMATLEDCAR